MDQKVIDDDDGRQCWGVALMELTHTVIGAQKFQDLQLAHWRARRADGLAPAWICKESSQCNFQFYSKSKCISPCPNLKAESTCYMLFYSDLQ